MTGKIQRNSYICLKCCETQDTETVPAENESPPPPPPPQPPQPRQPGEEVSNE